MALAGLSEVHGARTAVTNVTEAFQSLDPTKRALLVEDEILTRLDLAETFREAGWEVVEARSAEEAIAVLERDCDFNILLTDVHMTGPLNGLDLARFSKDRCPHIKVAVMSGLHRPDADERAGFDLFLSKPIFNLMEELLPLHLNADD